MDFWDLYVKICSDKPQLEEYLKLITTTNFSDRIQRIIFDKIIKGIFGKENDLNESIKSYSGGKHTINLEEYNKTYAITINCMMEFINKFMYKLGYILHYNSKYPIYEYIPINNTKIVIADKFMEAYNDDNVIIDDIVKLYAVMISDDNMDRLADKREIKTIKFIKRFMENIFCGNDHTSIVSYDISTLGSYIVPIKENKTYTTNGKTKTSETVFKHIITKHAKLLGYKLNFSTHCEHKNRIFIDFYPINKHHTKHTNTDTDNNNDNNDNNDNTIENMFKCALIGDIMEKTDTNIKKYYEMKDKYFNDAVGNMVITIDNTNESVNLIKHTVISKLISCGFRVMINEDDNIKIEW